MNRCGGRVQEVVTRFVSGRLPVFVQPPDGEVHAVECMVQGVVRVFFDPVVAVMLSHDPGINPALDGADTITELRETGENTVRDVEVAVITGLVIEADVR